MFLPILLTLRRMQHDRHRDVNRGQSLTKFLSGMFGYPMSGNQNLRFVELFKFYLSNLQGRVQ